MLNIEFPIVLWDDAFWNLLRTDHSLMNKGNVSTGIESSVNLILDFSAIRIVRNS